MKISVNLAYCTQEVSDSAHQAVDSLNITLGNFAGSYRPFESMDELSFSLALIHPLAANQFPKLSRYYVAKTQTFFVGVPLDYIVWATGTWADRIDTIGAGLTAGLASVFKTRMSSAERTLVSHLILHSCDHEKTHPPDTVLHPGPVYLHYGSGTGRPSISFARPPVDIPDMVKLVTVMPHELAGFMARNASPKTNSE